MKDHQQVSGDVSSPVVSSQWIRSVHRAFIDDWHTNRHTLYTVLLVLLSTLVVVAYYLNHPRLDLQVDTPGYLNIAQGIQTQGKLVTTWRLPGYSLLILLVYALAGQDNLFAVTIVQGVLFVLASLELYILAVLVLRRSWLAFLIVLLVVTNPILLSFVKLVMPEALTLWLITSLALTSTLFVSKPRARTLWLVTLCTLLLFLTRPEWIYLPVPLFAYLLLVAARQGLARRMLPHVLVSLILLYIILGDYVYINAMVNHFTGVTAVENYNLLGKVLQYNMQDEAPSRYVAVQQIVDSYLARGIKDLYYITHHEPKLLYNHYALSGEYARAIIEHHPGEFLAKSVPLGLSLLAGFGYGSKVAPAGAFGAPLVVLQTIHLALYRWNIVFPVCAALWLLLLCWRRTSQLRMVQGMGIIVLLVFYGLVVTTLGIHMAYQRVRVPFDPLLILVVWGTLLTAVLVVVQHFLRLSMRLVDHYVARSDVPPAIAKLLTDLSRWLSVGIDVTRGPLNEGAETGSVVASSQPMRLRWLSLPRLRSLVLAAASRLSEWVRSVGRVIVEDWHRQKYVLFALLLLGITTIVVVVYYLNHSRPELTPDTPSYLVVVQRIQMQGRLVDVERLPGYPLLIVLVYAVAGQGNLFAVSVAQAILYVLATLELYVLAVLVLRRGWLAFLIGLLVGTNLILLSFIKAIMSESLALWLIVSLALVVALFIYRPQARALWLVTLLILLLFLTRAEWIYLPVPLFAYLLLVAARQGLTRRLLPPMLVSLVLLYAILGNYIYINSQLYRFTGVVEAQNLNAFGKVLQYNMQDEAPTQYAAINQRVDTYLVRGIRSPYPILAKEPSLRRDGFTLAGEYARAIIVRPG